ncbi:MAG TPA: PxKF domain-containing protein [Gaiellaceae bacterium]|nr:PxKF domain-containing protein [Gaiellaceae bacterium]
MRRGRALPRLLAAAASCVAIAAAIPLSSTAGPSTLPACGAADLVPRFAKLVVTQGPTSFTRAARGKEAVVRAHLTIPTTCLVARTQSISPTSATLTVTGGSASGPIANYNPLSGALGSAVLADSTADPLFLVPAAALRPGDGSTTSALTVAVRVTYTRVSSGVTTTGLITPAGAAGSTKTLTLDRKGNALRVLLIPLGDPASTVVQWDDAANASAQALMSAAARVFPVQDGWGTLATGQTGGVRFRVNQGLLDVRSLNLYRTASGQTKFCSNGSNFATSQVTSGPFTGLTLKGQLQQTLADYNAANPTQRADLALGVVKDAFAWPTNNSAGLICDDGRAATPVAGAPGAVGWVRVSTTSTYPTPGLMELAHNLGVVRYVLGVNTSFHSANVEADIGAPDQGYNVVHRKVLRVGGTLGNDHSVMNYNFSSIPYTNDNILAEPDQWNDLQCDLRPPSTSDPVTCGTIATSVGTSDGVAAGANIFGIDGTYDTVTGVVRVTNSRLIAQADPDAVADPASALRLRFLNGISCASPGTQLGPEFGVPVLGDEGHAEEFETGAPSGFHVNVPFPAGATVVQLTVGSDVKYCRAAQPGDVPDVTNVTPGTSPDTGTQLRSFPLPQPFGGTSVNGRAIAFDGRDLWATFGPNSSNAMDGKLYKVTTTGTLLRTENIGTPLGALAYDPERGTLYGGHYDLANRKPQLAGNVYEITTGTIPTVTKLFRYPFTGATTCAGGDPKAINGLEDLEGGFVLSADLAKQAYITTRLGVDVSSFSTVAAGADCNSGIARDHEGLWLASLATSDSTTFVHTSKTGAPDGVTFTVPGYRAQDIEFDDVTFAPKCALWTNQATSTVPQVRAYQVPCAIGATFRFSANAPDLVGTAYFTCGRPGDPYYPIASSLRDTDLTDAISTFTFTFYEQHSCGEGTPTIFVTASNGIYESPLTDIDADIPVAPSSKSPTAEIVAPFDGATFRVGTTIPYYGTALDPEDGALTGPALTWYLDGVPLGQSGTTFDRIAPAPGTHTVTLRATDAQGHISETSVTFHVATDTSAPQLSLTLPSPNGNPPWNTALPVIQLDLADNGATDGGVASVICFEDTTLLSFKTFDPPVAVYSEQLHPSIDGIEQISCTVTDSAGNQTTVNDFIYIDTTGPVLSPTVTPNPVVLNGTATASANATDATSGVASQACDPVVTSTVGTFTVTCTATDVAGNTSTATATYDVVFASGICLGEPSRMILQPINSDGSSVFKRSSTVAVRFRVCDALGLAIDAADVVTPPSPSMHPSDCTVPLPSPTPTTRAPVLCTKTPTGGGTVNESVDSTTPDTNFRWNGSGKHWHFNLGTKNLSAGFQYGFYIPLKDGTIIRFSFALK